MKRFSFILILITAGIGLFLYTCKHAEDDGGSREIVRVGNELLTSSDLNQVLPRDVNDEDSAALADDYINRWVRNKLFLRQAEFNLTEEEKDISQLLDEYRTSLLVNIYQQKMLEQKYSPLLSDKEIEEYYNQMQDNFTLQENIVKGFLLKVPMGAPNQGDVRRWCRSANSESLVKLENYSLQNARMFDSFLDTWVPFQRVNAILPEPIKNEERFLMYNRYYETTDEQFRYFLLVTDYMTIGNTAPLSYVEDRIRAILLNKKRGEYIKSLEKELYDEALQKKIINFY
ncbi:hypothetical protein [Marinilabilia rubra]|uniref:hypothetical protein n=1 Tax=Marinilabilia rubra TaxID=2162893 RepID=UPI001E57CF5F|nr:hypothetical protein [Marinilabilia rubra]